MPKFKEGDRVVTTAQIPDVSITKAPVGSRGEVLDPDNRDSGYTRGGRIEVATVQLDNGGIWSCLTKDLRHEGDSLFRRST